MEKRSVLSYCCVAILWFFGCTFEADEEFFKEIDFQPSTNGSIDLFESTDTLYVRGEIFLNYSISDIDFEDIRGFSLALDNQPLSTFGNLTGFNFRSTDFSDGYHRLSLTLTLDTNSGSLADILDQETYELTFERVVLIDNAPIGTTAIVSTERESDGSVTVTWEPYTGLKFEYYELTYTYGRFEETLRIEDVNQTSFNYDQFTGGFIFFRLRVFAKGGEFTPQATSSFQLGLDFELVEENGTFKVTWDEPRFPGYQGINIIIVDNYRLGQNRIRDVQITDLNAREYVFDGTLRFPYAYNIFLEVQLPDQNSFGQFLSLGSDQLRRKFSRSPHRYKFLDENTYYAFLRGSSFGGRTTGRLNVYSPEESELLGILAMSPDGETLFQFENDLLTERDPRTFNQIGEAYNLRPSLLGATGIKNFFVSNDKKLAIHFEANDRELILPLDWSTKRGGALIDFEPGSPGELYTGGTHLFDQDRRRFLNLESGQIFDYSTNQYVYFQTLTRTGQFAHRENDQVLVKELETDNVVRSINIGANYQRLYALNEHMLGVVNRVGDEDEMVIYDLETGQERFRVELRPSILIGFGSGPYFQLADNKLIVEVIESLGGYVYAQDLDE